MCITDSMLHETMALTKHSIGLVQSETPLE